MPLDVERAKYRRHAVHGGGQQNRARVQFWGAAVSANSTLLLRAQLVLEVQRRPQHACIGETQGTLPDEADAKGSALFRPCFFRP